MNPITAIIVTRGDVDLGQILESFGDWFSEVVIWDNGRGRVTHRELGAAEPGFGIHDDQQDLAVYGRYAAIEYAISPLIYVQDDDCVIPIDRFLGIADSYQTELDAGEMILSNMPVSRWPDYPDSCLVGWGALFHRDLPAKAFDRLEEVASEKYRLGTWTHGGRTFGPDLPRDTPLVERERLSDQMHRTTLDLGWFHRECDVAFTVLTPHVKADVGFTHLPWAEDPARAMHLSPRPDRPHMLDLARKVRDAT